MADEEQAEAIADSFSAISQEYDVIQPQNIQCPPFIKNQIPFVSRQKIRKYLEKIKTNKATAPGDIPAKIVKYFAAYICIPLANLFNACLQAGHWPLLYKCEYITPVPKQIPTPMMNMLRPISILFLFDKIFQKIITDWIISDMKEKMDKSQFGNQKHLSIQHYLVRMVHRILTSTDNNSRNEVNAVLCLFIDLKTAFSKQDHTIGVQSFVENGVRPSIIPLLISYFQHRTMQVRWHGKISGPRDLPGSGAMGSSLGIWEFLSQTNTYGDFIPQEDRYKFVDDLSTLEVINLLNIGLSSFNMHSQVPNDIPTHGQFIASQCLKSQQYLNKLNNWAQSKQMLLSKTKTKAMIFNFTDNYKFTTRLDLQNEQVEIVDEMKLLGCQINNTLSWDANCDMLIKKVNMRMQLLRSVWSFGSNIPEMKHLWITYCRSVLEQSCVLWHSTLTKKNSDDLERCQKTFAKLLLGKKYTTYSDALLKIDLISLSERRRMLNLQWAKCGIQNNTLNDLFPLNNKIHKMDTRSEEKYKVQHFKTERTKRSSVVFMRHLLNEENRTANTKKRKRIY